MIVGTREVYYFTGFKTSMLILPTYLFFRMGHNPILLTGTTEKSIPLRLLEARYSATRTIS